MMKRLLTLSLTSASLITSHGFAKEIVIVEAPPRQYVAVQEAPPTELVEEITPCPGPDFMWVKGHWAWNGQWTWSRGYWDRRPHPEATWAPGVWYHHHHHHGWVYEPGRWR